MNTSEKVAQVNLLVSMDVPVVRACRRVGLPKETYYWHRRRKSPAAPSPNGPQGEAA